MMAVLDFQFTEPFGDARVEELKLLSWTAQHGELSFASVPVGPWHDLLVSLVSSELLTVFSIEWAKETYSRQGLPDLAGPEERLVLVEDCAELTPPSPESATETRERANLLTMNVGIAELSCRGRPTCSIIRLRSSS